MKGFWGRGVEVIGEWVKKRESGGVGGDPMGSTDPKVILWGPQILRCQGIPSLHQIGM